MSNLDAMTEKPIIKVKEGKIRGIRKKSDFSGVEYYSFFGIPYGESTADRARFKDPVKIKPWTKVLDATTERGGCLQFALQLRRIAGSEDCLYNNIHTPHLPTEDDPLKPVIVNIHPGGFFHGSPDTYYHGSPEYVMHRDIVYVSIAYRLHVLGFLNLDLPECSGNQGLKDVILGLQWIRDNIKVFGGDPDNVTLLGSSSGSTIVHALLISPAAKGLFHKAIAMGFYIFSPTSVFKGDQKKEIFTTADAMGCNRRPTKTENKKRLVGFYKKAALEKFFSFRPEMIFNNDHAIIYPCCPFAVSNDQNSKTTVFPKTPDQLIDATARIPLMFGICEREAVMGFAAPYRAGSMENFYSSYRQNCWGWGAHITDEQVEEIKEQMDAFYFKNDSLATAPLSLKVDVQSDISFSNVYKTLIDVVSADLPSSVFVYKFQFDGNLITMKDVVQPLLEEKLDGTYHAADFCYWSQTKQIGFAYFDPNVITRESRQMVETFTKLISTFARTGDPNYDGLNTRWNPTTPENPCYMNISDNLSMIEGKLNGERMKFWEGIMEKYKKE